MDRARTHIASLDRHKTVVRPPEEFPWVHTTEMSLIRSGIRPRKSVILTWFFCVHMSMIYHGYSPGNQGFAVALHVLNALPFPWAPFKFICIWPFDWYGRHTRDPVTWDLALTFHFDTRPSVQTDNGWNALSQHNHALRQQPAHGFDVHRNGARTVLKLDDELRSCTGLSGRLDVPLTTVVSRCRAFELQADKGTG